MSFATWRATAARLYQSSTNGNLPEHGDLSQAMSRDRAISKQAGLQTKPAPVLTKRLNGQIVRGGHLHWKDPASHVPIYKRAFRISAFLLCTKGSDPNRLRSN